MYSWFQSAIGAVSHQWRVVLAVCFFRIVPGNRNGNTGPNTVSDLTCPLPLRRYWCVRPRVPQVGFHRGADTNGARFSTGRLTLVPARSQSTVSLLNAPRGSQYLCAIKRIFKAAAQSINWFARLARGGDASIEIEGKFEGVLPIFRGKPVLVSEYSPSELGGGSAKVDGRLRPSNHPSTQGVGEYAVCLTRCRVSHSAACHGTEE